MYSRIISKSPVRMSAKSAPMMNISQAKRREKFVLSLKATLKKSVPSSMEWLIPAVQFLWRSPYAANEASDWHTGFCPALCRRNRQP